MNNPEPIERTQQNLTEWFQRGCPVRLDPDVEDYMDRIGRALDEVPALD